MKLPLFARFAMLALTAAAIIYATPALAASPDSAAGNVYAKESDTPTTHPVPNPGTGAQFGQPDLKVTYVSKVAANGGFEWTYTLENIGPGKALNVRMEMVAVQNGFNGSHAIETETSWQNMGDLNSGATRTVVVTCVSMVQHPPCYASSVRAHLDNTDSHPGNDWDTD